MRLTELPYTLIAKTDDEILITGFIDGIDMLKAMELLQYCNKYEFVLGYKREDNKIFTYSEYSLNKIYEDDDFRNFLDNLQKKGKLSEIQYLNDC